jgi:serine/threonine protein kinase
MIGKTLSHYQIISQLGKGGMGEVYLAEDTTLDRKVALKFLPEAFTSDPERMARFEREAKLLASLNHPNIAGIYGLEQADGNRFLVLEYVEGETLQARLSKGALELEDALELCRQIAEGLEAAHEKGVIHRDLKPANVMITAEEKVKILDFGLAKAFSDDTQSIDSSQSPTLTEAMTRPGVILGTAAYMSPEQAKGKSVDKRADIWAFGCILYECLTGKRAFEGETVTETLAAILRGEPDWDRLPPNLHPRIRLLLERCLEKQSKDRCGVISDARVDIQKVLADPSGILVRPVTTATTQKKLRTMLPWVAVTALFCLIIAGIAGWMLKPSPPSEPKQVMISEYVLPEDQQFFIPTPTIGVPLAVSPDGSHLAYSTTKGIYIRSMKELGARLISGTDADADPIFFSPDGLWIGYFSLVDQKLKRISVSGGAPTELCDAAMVINARWYEDNTIMYSELTTGICRIPAKGGTPEVLVQRPLVAGGYLLPDGKSVMFIDLSSQPYKTMVQSPDTDEPKVVFEGAGRYLSTGHLLYDAEGNLFAVPFDLENLETTGGAVSLMESPQGRAISSSGTLVYVPGTTNAGGSTDSPKPTLVWVYRDGREEPLGADAQDYEIGRISPDGTKIALQLVMDGNQKIWIWDTVRETLTPLTFDESVDIFPLWAPNGQRIIFASIHGELQIGVFCKNADGTGEVEELYSASDITVPIPWSWSGDGDTLVFFEFKLTPFESNIGMLSMEGDKQKIGLLEEKYAEAEPQISPDGRWIAYTSNKSSQAQIYVHPFPDVDTGMWQISTKGGQSPLWSPDGRELFYRNGDATMVVPIETEPTFSPGNPEILFPGKYHAVDIPQFQMSLTAWDIHPDGDKFLMIKPATVTDEESSEASTVEEPRTIRIVTNWFEELKDKVPVQ